MLRGFAGDDLLQGGPGNDRLNGSLGENRYAGGRGDDVLRSRNGIAESVDCGRGTDVARVDPEDETSGCETIHRG